MMTTPLPPDQPRNAVQKLYTLWIVSSLLMLICILALALLTSGQMRRYNRIAAEQSQELQTLREQFDALRAELDAARSATLAPETPAERIPLPPLVNAETDAGREGALLTPSPSGAEIDELLSSALRREADGAYAVADPEAAGRLLQIGLARIDDADWNGEAWARLALTARLVERDGPAELFARKAEESGVFPTDYARAAVRALLDGLRLKEAAALANRWLEQDPSDAQARLYLAEAHWRDYDFSAAADTLDALTAAEALALADRLRLGRILVDLEQWPRLDDLLGGLTPAPNPAPPALNFLRAVRAVRQERFPEALALLDNLASDDPAEYDYLTWRGVALFAAEQFEAARDALDFTVDYPNRPQAWYWRGLTALQIDGPEQATQFFGKALEAAPRYAPAWEALAAVAFANGDLPSALYSCQTACLAMPRRASSQYLLARIRGRMMQKDACEDALRTAVRLEPAFGDRARRDDEFRRLFDEDELLKITTPGNADSVEQSPG